MRLASQVVCILTVSALVGLLAVSASAQFAPPQVMQGSDGTLYLVQDNNAWTIVPSPIADADLSALRMSGELERELPSSVSSESALPGSLRIAQASDGTIYLVEGGNAWTVVPPQLSDADIAGFKVLGQLNGDITSSMSAAPAPAESAPTATPLPGRDANGPLTGTTIKIVSSLPRTGSGKGQTDTLVNAFKMALDEVNSSVGGATIVYQDLDDATAAKGAWDAAKEAENANQAVNDPQVMAYIGTYNSGAAKVSIPILCKANLGMISPANTYPGLTKNLSGAVEPNEPDVYYPGCKRNFARVLPTDEIQGAAAAEWTKQIGATRAYVLDDADLYGHGIAVVYANTADKLGIQVVGGPDGMDAKASDYRALGQKVRQSGADIVFFGGITQDNAGKLFQDLRSILGPSVKLMGPDGLFEKAFIDAAGPAAEGVYITFGGVPPGKLTGAGATWYSNYKQRFDSEPEADAGYGYESMKVVLDALRRATANLKPGTDAGTVAANRAAVRDAIIGTRNFDGALGTWSFTDTGDTTITAMSGRLIKNGAFDDANAIVLQVP